jgi:hypothetical protein
METPTMYYLVSLNLARAMQGGKVKIAGSNNPRGKVYGIFSSPERAEAHGHKLWPRGFRLFATIIAQ